MGRRILTGIQPSGILHIGNYFGAMKASIELEDLRMRIRRLALDYLACGLDPEKTAFFRQSDIQGVCELTWILNTITGLGLLERAHSYKDKIAKGFIPNGGLFTYPSLMAADILLYKSNAVPVGKDQKQHLEITRDIAIKFNQMYREVFVIPEPIISESVAVIPGTDGQKMSKSYNNTIELFGNEKAIRKKIMSIPTDSTPMEDPKDPDKCNIFALFKLFSNEQQVADLAAKYRAGNFGYGHAKQALFEAYMDYFAPMRRRREELEKEPGYIDEVLRKGAEKANAVAAQTMDEVYRAVGLR